MINGTTILSPVFLRVAVWDKHFQTLACVSFDTQLYE